MAMQKLAKALRETKGEELNINDMHMIADINRIRMNQEWMSDLLRKAEKGLPRKSLSGTQEKHP